MRVRLILLLALLCLAGCAQSGTANDDSRNRFGGFYGGMSGGGDMGR